MVTILFLSANPLDSDRIATDEELREIDLKLRGTQYRDNFQLQSHGAVRIADLQELLLRYEPQIVHFSGHGSKSNCFVAGLSIQLILRPLIESKLCFSPTVIHRYI